MNKNQNQQFDEDKYQDKSSININRQLHSIKKSSRFYIHQDPNNLNYYSRFSPNRKQIKDEQQLMKNSSLCKSYQKSYQSSSIKSSRISNQQKQNNLSQNYVHFINQTKNYINIQDDNQNEDQFESENDQQDDNVKICNINYNRGEIYIDQEELQDEGNCHQDVLGDIIIQDLNYDQSRLNKNIEEQKIISQYQQNENMKNKKSQKQLINQQSNNYHSYNLQEDQGNVYPSQGTQIFIAQDDEDQENYEQYQQTIIKKQQNDQQLDEQNQIISISKPKQTDHRTTNKEKIQSKSQNISFSFESDLSQIEQKWNSYFQSEDNQAFLNNNLNNPSIIMTSFQSPKVTKVLQNVYKNQHDRHNRILDDNQNKDYDSQSDEELPSFSTPNTSAYKNQYLQNYKWESPKVQSKSIDQNGQKKSLKRHYTFGHQLNKAFQYLEDDHNNNINHDSIKRNPEPLFKKLISNRILQTFKEQKSKKLRQKNKKQKSQFKIQIKINKNFQQEKQKIKKMAFQNKFYLKRKFQIKKENKLILMKKILIKIINKSFYQIQRQNLKKIKIKSPILMNNKNLRKLKTNFIIYKIKKISVYRKLYQRKKTFLKLKTLQKFKQKIKMKNLFKKILKFIKLKYFITK